MWSKKINKKTDFKQNRLRLICELKEGQFVSSPSRSLSLILFLKRLLVDYYGSCCGSCCCCVRVLCGYCDVGHCRDTFCSFRSDIAGSTATLEHEYYRPAMTTESAVADLDCTPYPQTIRVGIESGRAAHVWNHVESPTDWSPHRIHQSIYANHPPTEWNHGETSKQSLCDLDRWVATVSTV